MTEPTKCLDHLETDEGDFFCHLAIDHDGYHQFDWVIEAEYPGPAEHAHGHVLRRECTVRWQSSMILEPIIEKEA
jgi:hypothetical protein